MGGGGCCCSSERGGVIIVSKVADVAEFCEQKSSN